MCVRDSELVRMSRNAFKVMSHDSPLALSTLFSTIARRLTAAWDVRLRGGKTDRVRGSHRVGHSTRPDNKYVLFRD